MSVSASAPESVSKRSGAAVLLQAVDAACKAGAVVAAGAVAVLAIMLIVEVLTTTAFNWSQPWAVEYSTYLQAIVLFCGSGWALRTGGHIRVALIFAALPAGAARLLDMACTAFALGLFGFVSWALVEQALRSVALGSRSSYVMLTPLGAPQGFLAAGFVLLAAAFAARLARLALGQAPEETGAFQGGVD